ncbi:MAG: hypothetical protein ACUZ8O_17660, partial [Candidatus Anammoxibacter sp.]
IGCDVIAFVGLDLSNSGELSYSKGLFDIRSDEMKQHIKTGFKDIPDKSKWTVPLLKEGVKKGGDPGYYAAKKRRLFISREDIFGEKVETMGSYLTFRITFENMIRVFNGIVINATEAGLPIEGAKEMRLSDFVDEYCSVPEIDTFSAIAEKVRTKVSYNLEGLLANVKEAKTVFMGIKKNGVKILKYTHKVKDLMDKGQRDSAKSHNLLDKIEILTEKVKHPMLNIIAAYHYKLELYLKKQEVQDIDEIDDKWEKLEKQLIRAENFYPELGDAITLFLKPLNRLISSLEREDTVDIMLMDSSRSEYEKYFKAGKIYKSAGIVTTAVKCLEIAIEEYKKTGMEKGETGSGENDVNEELQLETLQVMLAELYLKQFRFYDAKVILEKVISWQLSVGSKQVAKDKREKVSGLFKKCERKIKVWEERKKDMGKLLKDAESNYGGHYESGNFYFKVKDYAMAEKAYLKAVNSLQSSVSGDQLAGERSVKSESSIQFPVTSNQRPEISNPQSSILNVYYGLANTYLTMDESDKAVDTIGKIIELEPENPYPYCDLGRIATKNNNVEAAENFFKKAIELAPNIEDHYKLLAGLYVNHGQTEKATALYDKAILVNPGNPAFVQTLAGLYKNIISNISQQKETDKQ